MGVDQPEIIGKIDLQNNIIFIDTIVSNFQLVILSIQDRLKFFYNNFRKSYDQQNFGSK